MLSGMMEGGTAVEEKSRTYCCIDLKSFYASVECVDRGLDRLTTNLVVADSSRTDKTICLAVSPSLKALGVPGRPRLFEVKKILSDYRIRTGKRVEYITAVPRMALYEKVSGDIYSVYLRYVAPEDVHVYSIDEVFIDLTKYIELYRKSAHELVMEMIRRVLAETGITATRGIGPNMYLAKICMDITAKKAKPDRDGVRIRELDIDSYRRTLWEHEPITDFWRVGPGIARRLANHRIYTMGDIARTSINNEDVLFKELGVDAELLIDHAWGYEPTTMEMIKSYRPSANSMGSGQVLMRPYSYREAEIIVREMTEELVLNLTEKDLVAGGIVLHVGYDTTSLSGYDSYGGEVKIDYYGKKVPKSAHGTVSFTNPTNSMKKLTRAAAEIYARQADPALKVRRISVTAINVIPKAENVEQVDLFSMGDTEDEKSERLQKSMVSIQKKFGKNMLLKGHDLKEGATKRERNRQIGGHKA